MLKTIDPKITTRLVISTIFSIFSYFPGEEIRTVHSILRQQTAFGRPHSRSSTNIFRWHQQSASKQDNPDRIFDETCRTYHEVPCCTQRLYQIYTAGWLEYGRADESPTHHAKYPQKIGWRHEYRNVRRVQGITIVIKVFFHTIKQRVLYNHFNRNVYILKKCWITRSSILFQNRTFWG